MRSDRHPTRRLATVTSLEARRRKSLAGAGGESQKPERAGEPIRPAEVLVPDYVEATKSRQFGQVLLFLVQERPAAKISWRTLMLDFLIGSILDIPELDSLEAKDYRDLQLAARAAFDGLDRAWGEEVPLVRLSWPEAQALMWETWAVSAIADEEEEGFSTRRLLRRWGVKAELPGPVFDYELTATTRKVTGGLESPEGLMEVLRNAWAAGDWGLYYDLFLDAQKEFGLSAGEGDDGKKTAPGEEDDGNAAGAGDAAGPKRDISGRTDFMINKIEEDIIAADFEEDDDEGGRETFHVLDVRRLSDESSNGDAHAVAWVAYVRGDETDPWQEEIDRLELEETPAGQWLVSAVAENAWPAPALASDTPFSISADYALDRLAAYAFSRFSEEAERAEREYFQSSAIYDLEDFPGYSFFVDYFLFEWQVPGMWGTVAQVFAEEEELAPRWRQAFRRLLVSRKSFFEVVATPYASESGSEPDPGSKPWSEPGSEPAAEAAVEAMPAVFSLYGDSAPPVLALNARPFLVRDLLNPDAPPFTARALGDRRMMPEEVGEVVTGRVVEWLGEKYFTPAIMVVPPTMAEGIKSSLANMFSGAADIHGLSRRRAERLAGSFERIMFLPTLFSLAESSLEVPEVRPRRRTALLEEAELLVEDGFSLDAGLYLKRILARYPEEPRALLAMGEVEKNLGHIDDARAAFERLLERDAANLEAACGLAELHLATGKSEEARLVLQKALDAATARPRPVPVSEYDRESRAMLRFAVDMAVAQASARNRPQTEHWAKTAARLLAERDGIDPHLAELAFEAAISLLDLQAYQAAAAILEPLSKAEAERPIVSQVLGVAYMRMGRFRKAATAYAAAARKDADNYTIWLGLADARLALGHLKLAEEAYVRCLSLAPGQVSALNNLGVTLLKRGQFFAAAELFRQAVEIAPEHVNANINLAVLLEHEGRIEEAQRHVGRVLAVDPQNSAALELATRLARRTARRAVTGRRPAGAGPKPPRVRRKERDKAKD